VNAKLWDWADLEIFLAAARGGSLVAAASELGVNASTVQRRIGKLEGDLGTRLFDRSPRGYGLTGAGEALLEHARAAEEELWAGARKVTGRDRSLEGVVRVTTVDDLAFGVLPPIVRAFRKRHRRVEIDLDIQAEFSDLGRRQADVAIRFGAAPQHDDVIVKHVTRVDVALYGSKSYLEKHGTPSSLPDLRDHALVRATTRFSRLAIEQIMDRYSDASSVALRSNSMLVRHAAIREGIGIGWLGHFMGEHEPELSRLDLKLPSVSSDLWMLVHVDLRTNARVRAFVDFVHAAFVARRARFASAASASRVAPAGDTRSGADPGSP